MAGIEEPVDQPDNVQPQAQIPIPAVQDNNIPAAQPRAHCTHKDDLVSSLLSKLSLHEKLSKNKEIEDQNKNRDLKNYNHLTDPLTHPKPGSENASFITIDEVDLKDLKDPSILARFSNFLPDYLLICITCEN